MVRRDFFAINANNHWASFVFEETPVAFRKPIHGSKIDHFGAPNYGFAPSLLCLLRNHFLCNMLDNLASLEDLIQKAGVGDYDSFAVLYDRTNAHLFGIAMRLLRNKPVAEDVLQEAFLSVWKHAKNYRCEVDGRQFAGMSWLISIVRNKCLDALRSSGYRREETMIDVDGESDRESADMRWSAPSADQLLDQSVNKLKIADCFQSLESGPRQSLALAYYQGLSHSEISAQMGAPIGSVKSWVRRGLM
ncbi:RNA polymerase sigma factor, partial [Rhodoferax sp.]|uniref:RNA polymerase sigma factor n=1 Tax=Rhodoferax sp. TaxID=50421 RepID=UPI0037837E7E